MSETGLRRTVAAVCLLNLAYFGVEFGAALSIGAASLFADSIDFLEDAAVNFLVFVALAWSAARLATVGRVLAALLLVPSLAVPWAVWRKFHEPVAPDPYALGLVGLGALVVNGACALLLVRHRREAGGLARAAFLSARNDAIGNVAIIAAAATTLVWTSVWPDVVVALGLAAMNLDAAREVWEAAGREKPPVP